jgi:mannitol-1-phosphate/altronate dehydrogenase
MMMHDGWILQSSIVEYRYARLLSTHINNYIIMSNTEMTHWLSSSGGLSAVDCLCLGTGRFLRCVLVPALVEFAPVALIQTRGNNFMQFMSDQSTPSFPVDTVLESGEISTDHIPCAAAFSLGSSGSKRAFYEELSNVHSVSIIGVGVTEAGLASPETQAMEDLFELLVNVRRLMETKEIEEPRTSNKKVCILNTDNVPNNGAVLLSHMKVLANLKDPSMIVFLENRIAFLDTMVDRITSQRDESHGLIPRAEPIPEKALVILDEHSDLPSIFCNLKNLGVVVRTTRQQLQADIALKLRVANGTHTAVAHLLALQRLTMTSCLSEDTETARLLTVYLDELFETQILQAPVGNLLASNSKECRAAYVDWRRRLLHPHFGLSSFFITQNGAAKGGIRLSPTVRDLIMNDKPVTAVMAFAFAILLRWLTPKHSKDTNGVFTGWLSESNDHTTASNDTVEYADKMRYNLGEGWYEFKCACMVSDGQQERILSEWLGSLDGDQQPCSYYDVIQAYLEVAEGGNLADVVSKPAFSSLVKAIAALYARIKADGDVLTLIQEMHTSTGV